MLVDSDSVVFVSKCWWVVFSASFMEMKEHLISSYLALKASVSITLLDNVFQKHLLNKENTLFKTFINEREGESQERERGECGCFYIFIIEYALSHA